MLPYYYGYYYANYYADLMSGRTWRKEQEKEIFYKKLMEPKASVLDPFVAVASASASSSSAGEEEETDSDSGEGE